MSGLFLERLASLRAGDEVPALVLWHGWGVHSHFFRPWLAALRQHADVYLLDLPGFGRSQTLSWQDERELIDQILPVLPERSIWLGWSWGGQLATLAAAQAPERCAGLLLVGSNPHFLAEDTGGWPGMAASTFTQFYQAVAQQPAKGLRRFLGLMSKGCDDERAQLNQALACAEQAPQADPAVLLAGLRSLQRLDTRALQAQLAMPVEQLLFADDQLVPADVSQHVTASLLPGGHLPSHEQGPEVAQALQRLLLRAGLCTAERNPGRDKQAVARSFSLAAERYEQHDALQREVADTLISLLPSRLDGPMVDLGCGTGRVTALLQSRFGDAPVIGMDLAQGMLQFARQRQPEGYWVGGDAENWPLADASVGGIFSSLAIQWCENLDALFGEVARVLKPGGWARLSTLGPNSLSELRQAWLAVDQAVHVNRFLGFNPLREALQRAGLTITGLGAEQRTLRYAQLRELVGDLKGIGAHNVNDGRPLGLTGRRRWQALQQAYEQQRDAQGLLPLSYEIFYLQVSKRDGS